MIAVTIWSGPRALLTLLSGMALKSLVQAADTVWHNLGEKITGEGTTQTVSETAGPPHNFYRVIAYESR